MTSAVEKVAAGGQSVRPSVRPSMPHMRPRSVATSRPVVSVMYLGHSHSLWYASLLWWGHGE
jgi:hypothetical protein